MKILGMNIGHDSGVCLMQNGKVLAAINEERLSRIKMHHGFPYRAIEEALAVSQASVGDLNIIAVEGKEIMPQEEVGLDDSSGDFKKKVLGQFRLNKFFLGTETGLALAKLALRLHSGKTQNGVKKYFRERGFQGDFIFIDHHESHAASAYYTQKQDEGLAITIDASGEGYCSKVYRCSNHRMELVHRVLCYHSPAYYYAYITKLLGFKPLRHEGKITGLAALGKPEETSKILEKYIVFDKSSLRFVNYGGYHFDAMRRLKKDLKNFTREDVAAGIQHHCEELVCAYVSAVIEKFNNNKAAHVFLAGGLFANVKINQRVKELPKVKSIWIFPNMGDGGIGFGSALQAAVRFGGLSEKMILDHLYLARNHTGMSLEPELKKQGLNYRKSENIAADIAELLVKKKVVACFQGAMEYGPRALGHRSIIYAATDKSVNTWLNQRLKRTEFMPFAPYVRDVDYKEYFKIDEENLDPYKFMTITCEVTEKCHREAPAITHVDGTARPQIIFRDVNLVYYDILTEYKKLTGIGVLVNTSFNMHEEPIIDTPHDAIETFKLGSLDVLAIGDYLVFP